MVQYQERLTDGFGAVADPTRRAILERLGRGNASVSELANAFDITLTGVKKHVRILEDARLVSTEKTGRVRTCRLGPRRLDAQAQWIERFHRLMDGQFDRMEAVLAETRPTKKEKQA